MIFAQILNGRLHHKFSADAQPQYAPDIVIVDITGVTPEPQEGWTWDGHLFIPPVQPPLSQSEARAAQMRTGLAYADTGVIVPLTSDDALALLQVKAAFEMGVTSTVLVFSNSQKLPMTPDKFPAFAAWFAGKRNSFYTE